ncbi:DNA/RNA helicase, superfamily II [Marinitoga piezophila KA3]|uniref:RNA helicase n=1 Tax=Marinitoga piezophila (strain DSM 14283 / JCM 11233 / KA3) TaxID=443254 RepID=H2J601_MARPK|nr:MULTISPECIES: DEAD/DEAH box helicase [Marinitoga]AEX86220.1 DNA/RNA helicase, superfamily II [Marinitoga piezophila KA3]APT76632.1 RNA helicase [Marinitoga sp. 1137]
MEKLVKFEDLGLSESTLKALKKKGFEEPTPIQEKVIPILLQEGIDVIGQAQTGTGKTAAFGLPLIEKLEPSKKVKALILTPTRELAIQVAEEINSLKGRKKLNILPIYGGQSIENQISRLKKGIDIVVGTPGRILDHIRRKTLDLKHVSYVILDEADEMLDMGFIDDVEEILSNTPEKKQILLFSATMPSRILKLAKKYMSNYKIISVKPEQLTTELTEQIYFEVNESDKFEALCRIIDIEPEFYGLVFCRTKVDVDTVSNRLIDRGYSAEALHGDLSQYQRERILRKFKTKRANILVATDVAARGIDISDLTHVINYSLPQNPESYVHRIGRTGRAGKEGTAITFVTPEEYRKLLFIKRISKSDIKKKRIPKIKDVIESKKNRIKTEINNILESETYENYLELANEMLENRNANEVLAAVLKYAFQDELDERNYNEIREVKGKSFVDKKGKTRLFVALGKDDGITKEKILKLIKDYTKLDNVRLRDVRILDKFSFITVSFEDAEIILESFKKKRRGRKPIIAKAKEKSRKAE